MTLPAGYRERPVRPEDAEAVRALRRAASLALTGVPFDDPDWPQVVWAGPGVEPGDHVVVEAPDGTVAGYGGVQAWPPFTTPFTIGTVHPEHLGRGVGAALIASNERRTARFTALAPADARLAIHAGTLADEPRCAALFTAHGYVEVRRFLKMAIAFDGPPSPPDAIAGVEILPFRPGRDERALFECHVAAFADHWGERIETWDDWEHEIYLAPGFDPGLWLLAWDGDALGGYVGCYERSRTDAGGGYVEVLGVHPDHRRRGLGEALLRAAFVELHRRGRTGVDLGVDSESPTGADRLYRRVGMHGSPRYAHWERELRPAGA
jgi:mycothiol synthase